MNICIYFFYYSINICTTFSSCYLSASRQLIQWKRVFLGYLSSLESWVRGKETLEASRHASWNRDENVIVLQSAVDLWIYKHFSFHEFDIFSWLSLCILRRKNIEEGPNTLLHRAFFELHFIAVSKRVFLKHLKIYFKIHLTSVLGRTNLF